MTTNDYICKVHNAILDKVQERCSLDGNNQFACQVADDIIGYASQIPAAFANDGKIDDAEKKAICDAFAVIINKYVPSQDGVIVDKAWNGWKIAFFTIFDGVKFYLNKWFNLNID